MYVLAMVVYAMQCDVMARTNKATISLTAAIPSGFYESKTLNVLRNSLSIVVTCTQASCWCTAISVLTLS